ncbi:hypothetical protein PLESTB_000529200 [Pleodorina starrii]|uniref:Uncharacterized protein n=1 Tax=Pleodorina starrii TaxID=330485 RepID=A0A9W6F0C9_9CHLO|nr:hypothetical protein PLESTM_000392600 [Pleodorina starrii]GLC51687.1 hypothetical protein PLESTB_000529200 [Pleodorina starrii]
MAAPISARACLRLSPTSALSTGRRSRLELLPAAPITGRSSATSPRSSITTRFAPNAGESGLSGRRPSQGPPTFSIRWTEGIPPPGPFVDLNDELTLKGAGGASGARGGVTDPAVQEEAAANAVEEAAERAEQSLPHQEPEEEEWYARGEGRGGEAVAAEGSGGGAGVEKQRDPPSRRINILLDIPVD